MLTFIRCEWFTLSVLSINYIKDINLIIKQDLQHISLEKSCILARAHSTLAYFNNQPISDLSKVELFANALICWKNTPRTGKDMQNALKLIGKSINMLGYNGRGNHNQQFCPDNYDHGEWRNQISELLISASDITSELYPLDNVNWSEWSQRLKRFLEIYWPNLKSPQNNWNEVKRKIIAPKGLSKTLVHNTLIKPTNNYTEKIRMTTFHDIKGETVDAALIISSKDKKSRGGHFEQWIATETDKKEYIRFAYVASSRPKHLLIWAIPAKTNKKLLKQLEDMGFTIE